MSAAQIIADALSGPGQARISFTGMSPQGAAVMEPDAVQIVEGENGEPAGIIADKRGAKVYLAWKNIIMIESIPKEEA